MNRHHRDVLRHSSSDYEAVQKSLMEGKPTPSSTAFGKSMMQLADRLGGKADPVRKTSSLGGLLGLFNKSSK